MGPDSPLPISNDFTSPEQYVDELLQFVTSSDLLKTLCGGVHILDFFTREPDLYSQVIPKEWRTFFHEHEIMNILDLLMREDVNNLTPAGWRDGPSPPASLINYIQTIRRLCLERDFKPVGDGKKQVMARDVARGMNTKKVHEIDHFSRYVSKLTDDIASSGDAASISHLVDFGAGQGYLPRCLASPPFNKHLVAIESKQSNIEGAMNWDVGAKLAEKPKIMRNKKQWRAELEAEKVNGAAKVESKQNQQDVKGGRGFFYHPGQPERQPDTSTTNLQISNLGQGSIQYVEHWIWDGDLTRVIDQVVDQDAIKSTPTPEDTNDSTRPSASFQSSTLPSSTQPTSSPKNMMIISLHSCGNLVHHGIRSLLLNPSVSAICLVGCCYNLLTTRLGSPTYKLPSLRTPTARLTSTSSESDPHGFPMSERLCTYPIHNSSGEVIEKGIRLNITARMMGVQAPSNWGVKDSAGFFQRHFYRALLQRIFLDQGLVQKPGVEDVGGDRSPLGWTGGLPDLSSGTSSGPPSDKKGPTAKQNDEQGGEKEKIGDGKGTTPIVIGSLKKSAYKDFVSYVRSATEKIVQGLRDPVPSSMTPDTSDESRRLDSLRADLFEKKMGGITDENIRKYERDYGHRKKELSVLWSLMAFSAGVIESVIVVDRWLFLKENSHVVERAWVENVFDYGVSPRNLVVVGIKKTNVQ